MTPKNGFHLLIQIMMLRWNLSFICLSLFLCTGPLGLADAAPNPAAALSDSQSQDSREDSTIPSPAETLDPALPGNSRELAVQDALHGLKTIVELWSAQKFSELYEWGTTESRHLFSKPQFVKFMEGSRRKLVCCWATLQEIRGFFKSPTQIYVQAKLGYENFYDAQNNHQSSAEPLESGQWVVSSSFDLQTFLLVRQQERWRIDLTEILAASGHIPDILP